jgi:hypothetical protein
LIFIKLVIINKKNSLVKIEKDTSNVFEKSKPKKNTNRNGLI